MLTERRSSLLSNIIEEYVDTAVPVGSQHIVSKHRMDVSSATVRLEMARLEEDGFINQPHTSAGRIPSDKGYRYYVESLMAEESLSWAELETIRHQFHQAEPAMEQWFQLGAAVLAHSVGNFAVVTAPRSKRPFLRHLQVVPLQETSALCVVVLNEARIRQQVVSFGQPIDQLLLQESVGRLRRQLEGLGLDEILAQAEPAADLDAQVLHIVVELIEQDSLALGDVFRDGVKEVFSQPEFSRSERILELMDLLEQTRLATAIPVREIGSEGINVVIGSENQHVAMRDCSVIVARYGADGGPYGVVAVLGPTRMRYARTIPTVRFLSSLLSDLVSRI